VSYYSKPFSADVGSIQIFCRIRLMENLSKPLYTESLSYKCNVKQNKCYKIINQLVVETLKGNNITQEGIYVSV
jgi:hypothetical protein